MLNALMPKLYKVKEKEIKLYFKFMFKNRLLDFIF